VDRERLSRAIFSMVIRGAVRLREAREESVEFLGIASIERIRWRAGAGSLVCTHGKINDIGRRLITLARKALAVGVDRRLGPHQ
jgi:hypothetical protein